MTIFQTQYQNGFHGNCQLKIRQNEEFQNISCEYGCGENSNFENIQKHMKRCDFRKLDCPNECGVEILFFVDLKNHLENICIRRLVLCSKGCNKHYMGNEEKEHIENNCIFRTIKCPENCGNSLNFSDLKNHLECKCLRRFIVCPLFCPEIIRFCDTDSHLLTDCKNRKIECPNLCGKFLVENFLSDHLLVKCVLRLASCTYCSENFPLIDLQKHEIMCNYKCELCAFQCGEKVLFKNIEYHNKSVCCHRFVKCTLKCNLKVRYIDLYKHSINTCTNRLLKCTNNCLHIENENLVVSESVKSTVVEFPKQSYGILRIGDFAVKNEDVFMKNECVTKSIIRNSSNDCNNDNDNIVLSNNFENKCVDENFDCDGEGGKNNNKQDQVVIGINKWNELEKDKQKFRRQKEVKEEEERIAIINEIKIHEKIFEVRQDLLQIHLKKECPNRFIKCSECGESVKQKLFNIHKNENCSFRIVNCPIKGCLKKVRFFELEKHENSTCRFLNVSCTGGCGEKIIQIKMGIHLKNNCTMRYVMCPLGCGETNRFFGLKNHVDNECIRRYGTLHSDQITTNKYQN